MVIVGAGGAGMTAALQAVDSGVNSVIIVEKGGSTGGNTSRATGGMNAAKTAYQDENEWSDATTQAVEKTIATAKEKYGDKIGDLIATVEAQFEAYKANPTGYFDSVELFALDTMVGGKCLNNLDLVMTLTGNSAEAIDWLATKERASDQRRLFRRRERQAHSPRHHRGRQDHPGRRVSGQSADRRCGGRG